MNGLFDFGALLNPQKAAVNPGAAPKAGPSPWYQSPKFWGDMGAALASGQRGGAAMAYAMKGQQGRAGLNAKLNFLRNAGAQPDELQLAAQDEGALDLMMKRAFTKTPAAKKPTSVLEFEAMQKNPDYAEYMRKKGAQRPEEYGLNPQYGYDENQNPVLLQLSKSGKVRQTALPDGVTLSKKPIEIDAGTRVILIDPITRQPIGEVPKENYKAAFDKGAGAAAGKSHGEALEKKTSLESKLPGLMKVVSELDELADKATYTYAGQGRDFVERQLGMEPNESAVARAEYVAKVDNQVLPLLRDTFGAAFTVKEGETLRATLGDPNKSPAEKKAVLRAFIEQKKRDVAALETRTNGVAETGIPDVKTLSDEQLRAIINGQ